MTHLELTLIEALRITERQVQVLRSYVATTDKDCLAVDLRTRGLDLADARRAEALRVAQRAIEASKIVHAS